MTSWSLTLTCCRLRSCTRLSANLADFRGSFQFASYQTRSSKQKSRDDEAKPDSGVQDRPPGVQDRPPGVQDRPPGVQDRPPGGQHRPPGGQHRPPGVQDRPPGSQHRPPGSQYRPPGSQHRPPGSQHRPPGGQHRPPGSQHRPPGGQHRPPGSQHRPPGGQYRPPGVQQWSQDSLPRAEGRVSSELQKLSLDDFPAARQQIRKEAEEDRSRETLFGVSPCLLALTQGRRRVWSLYVKEGDASKRTSVLQLCEEAHQRGVPIQRVSKKELDKMCSGRVHQGVCLQVSPLSFISEDEPPQPPQPPHPTSSGPPHPGRSPPLWLVLDAVQDPMNLGAIMRSAYYLGVNRIISSLHNSCPLTPVVSKASSGVMEVMEVFGYDSLADLLKVKVSQGWQVVGTVGAKGRGLPAEGQGLPVERRGFPAPVLCCSEFHMTRPTLLLMGGEGTGLSTELCLQCDVLLTIPPLRPLAPGVESLNVSVATGILLHSLLSSWRGGTQEP